MGTSPHPGRAFRRSEGRGRGEGREGPPGRGAGRGRWGVKKGRVKVRERERRRAEGGGVGPEVFFLARLAILFPSVAPKTFVLKGARSCQCSGPSSAASTSLRLPLVGTAPTPPRDRQAPSAPAPPARLLPAFPTHRGARASGPRAGGAPLEPRRRSGLRWGPSLGRQLTRVCERVTRAGGREPSMARPPIPARLGHSASRGPRGREEPSLSRSPSQAAGGTAGAGERAG